MTDDWIAPKIDLRNAAAGTGAGRGPPGQKNRVRITLKQSVRFPERLAVARSFVESTADQRSLVQRLVESEALPARKKAQFFALHDGTRESCSFGL